MERTIIEWAQLAPTLRVHANTDGAWLQRGRANAPVPRSSDASLDTASLETVTRRLLDGAVAAAFDVASPRAVPALTPMRWVWRLAGLYHLTHSTPVLLRIAAGRFARQRRPLLANWALERAREEHNHDLLALRDLAALGHSPERVVEALQPPIAMRLVAAFEKSARAKDPIGCVGYAYALERLAMTVDAQEVERVEAVLPAGARATRCLRVHSAIGSDEDHVAGTIHVLARCSADERRAVAVAAYETSRLCFETPSAGHVDDAAIAASLA